jgi:DNA (cytosine-5)-methyltransferase 3A
MQPSGLFGDLERIIKQPKDKGILLKDILEIEVHKKYFLSEKTVAKITRTNNGERCFTTADKALCLAAGYHKQGRDNQYIVASRGRNPENPKSRKSGLETEQQNRVYDANGISPALCAYKSDLLITGLNENQQKKFNTNINSDKANTLTLAQGRMGSSNEYMDSVSKIANITSVIRRLTPIECERLQTVADNYTSVVSDTQRYRMLGNGWTVDVIAHIFSYLK